MTQIGIIILPWSAFNVLVLHCLANNVSNLPDLLLTYLTVFVTISLHFFSNNVVNLLLIKKTYISTTKNIVLLLTPS